jgi:predicted ester cyclase
MNQNDKKRMLRIPLEVFNEGKLEVIDEVLPPDFVEHQSVPGIPSGREGVKQIATLLRSAFPDFRYSVEQEVAEGDLYALYLTASGTMRGDFMGMKATGKHARWGEMHLVRIEGGKAKEHWAVIDQLGMLQQLGLAPMPGQVRQAA